MKNKFTSGEWKVRESNQDRGDQTPAVVSIAPNGVTRAIICQVLPKSIGESPISMEEAKANANLISAAPDMLNALLLIQRQQNEPDENGYVLAADSIFRTTVSDAIKKAIKY